MHISESFTLEAVREGLLHCVTVKLITLDTPRRAPIDLCLTLHYAVNPKCKNIRELNTNCKVNDITVKYFAIRFN